MKRLLLGVLLTGLALVPLVEAKTPRQPAKPVCAVGKLVAMFNERGDTVTRGYRYYRCQLKEEQNSYLIQDFYWPSGKKQKDPQVIAKTGLHKWDDWEMKITGHAVGWYENGQKRFETNYVAGKPDGLLTKWHKNGQKAHEGQMVDGEAAGLWTHWYENGQKAQESQIVDGEAISLMSWYENGQKKQEERYVAGVKNGMWTYWYENGQKEWEGRYAAGGEEGLWTSWHENGQKLSEVQLKGGIVFSIKRWGEADREMPRERQLLESE